MIMLEDCALLVLFDYLWLALILQEEYGVNISHFVGPQMSHCAC